MSFLLGFAPQLLGMGASGLAEGSLLSGTIGTIGSSMTSMLFPFGSPFSGQQQQQSQGMSMTTIAIIGVSGIVVLTLLIK